MCEGKRISERIKMGIKIDAPFPQNMVLAEKVMRAECGYSAGEDCLHVDTQCLDQITRVRYLKTLRVVDEKTGKEYKSRYFEILMPDRYVPARETTEGVIRSEKDIWTSKSNGKQTAVIAVCFLSKLNRKQYEIFLFHNPKWE